MPDEPRSSPDRGRGLFEMGFSRHLGPAAAGALGLGVTYALVGFCLGGEVSALSGEDGRLAYLLAAALFLPFLLALLEVASTSLRSSGLYQVARNTGSVRRTFAVGWLLGGGITAACALLVSTVSWRIGAFLSRDFGAEVGEGWIVAILLALVASHELAGSGGAYRTRTVLTWMALAGVAALVVLGWSGEVEKAAATPPAEPRLLAAVALLCVGMWGPAALLELRDRLRRPRRYLRRAGLGGWGAALGLATLAFPWVAHRESAHLFPGGWQAGFPWRGESVPPLLLAVGMILAMVAYTLLLSIALLLIRRMAADGFLPAWLGDRERRGPAAAPGAVLLLSALAGLGAMAGPAFLAALAGVLLLAAGVLLLVPHSRRRERPAAALKLPFHPLFPILGIASAVFFASLLPLIALEAGLAWALAGVTAFVAYGRRHASRLESGGYDVSLEPEAHRAGGGAEDEEERYTVLVPVGGEGLTASLLRVGAAAARRRGGELLAMRVLPLREQRTLEELSSAARDDWEQLDALVSRHGGGVPHRSLIRFAPSPATGIQEAAAEQGADLIVLGWPGKESRGVVEHLFTSTSKALAILHGELSEEDGDVVVAVDGGRQSAASLELAWAVAGDAPAEEGGSAEGGGRLILLTVDESSEDAVTGDDVLAKVEEKAREAGGGDGSGIETVTRVEKGPVETVLKEEVEESALLILGATVDPLLGQSVFGGRAVELVRERSGPTLLVKAAEAHPIYWWRRVWNLLAHPLPSLSKSERSVLFRDMRDASRAGIDFYMLILFSALIATAGLLLNSAAVIIGAMLVAPLMSPIVAAGHGLVAGSLYMLRRAASSTLKGVGIAIAVGTALALIPPARPVTEEMLARGEPRLLDLLVAVSAGAGAAYAVARKNLSAALPGVAIAVALVPPLCVVGLGIGSSNFPLAAGAMLLFTTNLSAIILIGGLVFLLLGVRPRREESAAWTRRALLVAAVLLLVVSIPLWRTSRGTLEAGRTQRLLVEQLEELGQQPLRVTDVEVTAAREGFALSATVFASRPIDEAEVAEVRRRLEERLRAPVSLRLTVLEGEVFDLAGGGAGAAGGAPPPAQREPDDRQEGSSDDD